MQIHVMRHNGLGDLIMALPFLSTWLKEGHSVRLETDQKNHEWLGWLLPDLELLNCQHNPYDDFRQHVAGAHRTLNWNRLELADGAMVHAGSRPVNWQEMYLLTTAAAGLPLPKSLSPRDYGPPIGFGDCGSGEVLLFCNSTHESRTLRGDIVERLSKRIPNLVISPKYKSHHDLFMAIERANFVIASDSGAIHIAELMGAPWAVLHTTFDLEARHKYYRCGMLHAQSTHPASPCFHHGGCDVCVSTCASKFGSAAVEGIVDAIREAEGHGKRSRQGS
jgi:hypothetical protein